ncbi:MAG: flavin reductase [Treponema sp.]|nr:flavin reductase [Treponema sp.]
MDITTLFKLSSGLYIIGSKDNDRNIGCVVNTVVQTTSRPVTLSVCINKDNFTNTCIKKTGGFSVSILSENIKENVIGAFGFSSSREKDKFSDVSFGLTPSGMPYLKEGVTGFIQCKVISTTENFTHTIFIAEVQEAENISQEPPMTYDYYHRVIKGKTPKNASSYAENTKTTGSSYKCSICGYEFSGSKEEFENLPDDYKCPICSVAKSLFLPV